VQKIDSRYHAEEEQEQTVAALWLSEAKLFTLPF
jgi:hypothetical protein